MSEAELYQAACAYWTALEKTGMAYDFSPQSVAIVAFKEGAKFAQSSGERELAEARKLIAACYVELTPDGKDIPPSGIYSMPQAIAKLQEELAAISATIIRLPSFDPKGHGSHTDREIAAVVNMLDENNCLRAELAALRERMNALADLWDCQQADYPTDVPGVHASAAVRCCAREPRAAIQGGAK